MNRVSNRYCENTLIINKKVYKLEKVWRKHKNDKTHDSKGVIFPYPHEGTYSAAERDDVISRLSNINKFLDSKTKLIKYSEPRDCLLCDKKKISTKRYVYRGLSWEDGLIHYIDKHNIEPSIQFKQFILNNEISQLNRSVSTKIKSNANSNKNVMKLNKVSKDSTDYVVVERNQLLILDALMIHGGYEKKYEDVVKNFHRYSEHAGFLDFESDKLSKIIVSGKTTRVDKGDDEIYLPMSMDDSFEYEYIFHTHPPTPKPGGRAELGILYELPSIGDIYHFIDHHNEGNIIGSLIITPEGLYNIRKTSNDSSNIDIDEDMLFKQYQKIFKKVQNESIYQYGTDFTPKTFYTEIIQDTQYINQINTVLNKFMLQLDFYPRKLDLNNNWIIDTVFLVFRHNKTKK